MAQDTMRELSNSCCIVGAAESDEMGVLPHKSQMALHLESISNACADAGLKVSDVDGIFTAGAHSPALIAKRWASRRATLTAPAWAAAPSSSWWSTRSRRCIITCATSR